MKSEKSIMLMTENGNQLTEYGIMLTAFVITVIDSSFHSELRFRAFSCRLPVVGFNLVANS